MELLNSRQCRQSSANGSAVAAEAPIAKNFLDLRCPKCGEADRIDILASLWVRVTGHGTDADLSGDWYHDYCPESPAHCCACGHAGHVADFEQEVA